MLDRFPIILNDDHLARVAPVEGPLHDPGLRMLEDADLDMLAATLTQGRMRPIQIFAYGSLIWNRSARLGRTPLPYSRAFLSSYWGTNDNVAVNSMKVSVPCAAQRIT